MSTLPVLNIATNDLMSAINTASLTLGNGPDITSHFLFEMIENELFVSACNPPRIYSSIPLQGYKIDYPEVEENEEEAQDGDDSEEENHSFPSFTVEGKRLQKAIKAVNGLLRITVDSGSVNITSDKGSLELSSLDPTVFPPWRSMYDSAVNTAKTVPATTLHDALVISKPFMSTDEARRPELAQIYFTNGTAFACDGFGLSMAKSDSFKDIEMKFHHNDVASVIKFVKVYENTSIEIFTADKATFLKAEDGAILGMMEVPFNMPKPITSKYIDAFNWTPRRVWRVQKDEFNNALNFLSSGADESDYKVTLIDSEVETLSPPRLEMNALNSRGVLSYSLEDMGSDAEINDDLDLNTIEDLGERLYADRALQDKQGKTEGDDIASFSFNINYMKRSLDVTSSILTFGCNREGETKGYMLFKQASASGVEVVSILGWMV